jgi:hypothetical protein
VERPRLDALAEAEVRQPAAQFARRFPREREGKGVAGVGCPRHHTVCDTPDQHAGLAGAGTGDDRDQPRVGRDGVALLGVEVVEQR